MFVDEQTGRYEFFEQGIVGAEQLDFGNCRRMRAAFDGRGTEPL